MDDCGTKTTRNGQKVVRYCYGTTETIARADFFQSKTAVATAATTKE
jgi:hypothetical protein